MDSTISNKLLSKVEVLKSEPLLNLNMTFFQSFINEYILQSNQIQQPISLAILNSASARAQFCNSSSFSLDEHEYAQRMTLCNSESIFQKFPLGILSNQNLTSGSVTHDSFFANDFALDWASTLFKLYLVLTFSWFLFTYIVRVSVLKSTSEFFLAQLTFYVALLVVIPVAVINLFVRQFITVCFHLQSTKNKNKEQPKFSLLSGMDSFWAYDVFANSTNFFALYILEGESNLKKIRQKINDNVIKKKDENGKYMYERLEFRIIKKFGYYCWKNEGDFNIEKHIKYIEQCEATGANGSMTESQVFGEMGKLCNVPCSSDKPQWEILVVPNYIYDKNVSGNAGKKYYGLIFRFHHSYLDGVSAGHVLQNAMADSKVKMSVDATKEIKVPLYKKIFLYVLCATLGPLHFFRTLLLHESNCFHGPSLTGPKRIGWSKAVDLNALKVIKEKTKTTTTAVLLSCLGSSIRKLAIDQGFEVPNKIHAYITVAMLPYKSVGPQNRFALTLLPLIIGLDSSVDRLKAAYKSTVELAKSPDVFMSYNVIRFVGMFPTFVGKFVVDQGHATLLLSNVPGPSEDVRMFEGDRLVDAAAWSPIKGSIGIGMSLFSYSGKVRCAMVTDHSVMCRINDTRDLITSFEGEVTDLAQYSGISNDAIFIKDA